MKFFLTLSFLVSTLTSVTFAQSRTSSFYNEKGQLITDTTLTIPPQLTKTIYDIEDTLGNLIKENYKYLYYTTLGGVKFGDPWPLAKCIIYIKFSTDGTILEADVKNINHNPSELNISYIYPHTKELINKKIPINNKLANKYIYIPIEFNEVYERSNIEYYLKIKNNSYTVNWNVTAADFFEFNENYKKINFDEYTNNLNQAKLYKIKPDSTYDYYELRSQSSEIRSVSCITPTRKYILWPFIYKTVYSGGEKDSSDLDYIYCHGGRDTMRPYGIAMYRAEFNINYPKLYVILVNKRDTTIISNNDSLVKFIGKIDNINEAVLVTKLKGFRIINEYKKGFNYEINQNYRITKNGFEFLVYSGDSQSGYDLYQVIVENGILHIERLGVIEKYRY